MNKITGPEAERRLNEAMILIEEGQRHPPDTPMKRLGHLFGNYITLSYLYSKRGETIDDLGERRRKFLEGISLIEFGPEERLMVQPIIELARGEWTPELLEELVGIEERTFPELLREERKKIREGEELHRK